MTADPFIYVDQSTGRFFNVDLTPPCSVVSSSDDQGESFGLGEVCEHTDHQTLFTGPPTPGGPKPTGYPNVVYYCAIDGGASFASSFTGCSKSLDGGRTFRRTGSSPYPVDPSRTGGALGVKGACTGTTGHGFVDRGGVMYLPRGFCDQPYLAISRDQGDTWTRVQVSDLGVVVGTQDTGLGRSGEAAVEDHESRVAVDRDGNVYYLWIANDHLPYLAISRDGGSTFGRPRMVAAPGVDEVWGPSLDVGDPGRVSFSYVGTTTSPGGPFCARTTGPTTCETADGGPPTPREAYAKTTWNGYVGLSVTALEADPVFSTGTVNDPADPIFRGICGPIQCQQQLDFLDATVGPDGTPWATFVDGCPADAAKPCSTPGIGILGRLVAGPSLIGTEPEQPPSGATTPPGGGPSPPPPPGGPDSGASSPQACAATAGFRSVGVRPSGRGARLEFDRRGSAGPVAIDVFEQSRGRRVVGERLVARFTGRERSLRWDGLANRRGRRVTDGYLFVRFRTRGADGLRDTRRVTLRRVDGRLTRRRAFSRRATCDLVPSFKLTRPVFGGSGRPATLGISYRVAAPARVTVTVRRGGRLVRRFAPRQAPANRTVRLRVSTEGLRRGDYSVRLTAVGERSRVTSTLFSRRL